MLYPDNEMITDCTFLEFAGRLKNNSLIDMYYIF